MFLATVVSPLQLIVDEQSLRTKLLKRKKKKKLGQNIQCTQGELFTEILFKQSLAPVDDNF